MAVAQRQVVQLCKGCKLARIMEVGMLQLKLSQALQSFEDSQVGPHHTVVLRKPVFWW